MAIGSRVNTPATGAITTADAARPSSASAVPVPTKRAGWLLGDLKVLLYQVSMFGASLLPPRMAFVVARSLGRARCARKSALTTPVRREMEQVVGPGAPTRRWMRRYFEAVACESLEAYMHSALGKERMHELIDVRGLENLDAALARGKGAILCTGHVRGLFTFFVGLHLLGYKLNAVRRHPPGLSGPIGRWFNRRNTLVRGACNFLWMDEGANLRLGMHSAAALNRNEILIMLIDALNVSGSVEVDFLGRRLPLPSGHVVLAQVIGAPLLNFFIYRPEQWFPQVAEIGEPYDAPERIEEGVQHCVTRLEQDIRRHPSDWIWLAGRDRRNQF